MFLQQCPQGIHICSTLMHQPCPAAEHGRAGLRLNCLGLHEAQFRLSGRDHGRLGNCDIIFLALHERANVLWCDQLHFVAKRFQRAVLFIVWLSTPQSWHKSMPSGEAATTPS